MAVTYAVLVRVTDGSGLHADSGIFGLKGGDAFSSGLAPSVSDSMLVFGSSSGELPELSAYDITSGSYSGSWTALTPTLGTPEVEVINTLTTT